MKVVKALLILVGVLVVASCGAVLVAGAVSSGPHAVTSPITASDRRTTAPATSGGSEDTSAGGDASDVDAVRITSCKADQFGFVKFGGKLHNTHTDMRSYSIGVEFLVGGERVDEGSAFANSVSPGQTIAFDGMGGGSSLDGKRFTCRVTNVTSLPVG